MKVHFIGAGPGDPDLITIRGKNHISQSPVCLYAGSLVPRDLIKDAPPNAEVYDTASMTLDEIIAIMADAFERNIDVARIHSGDPSLYGAIGEQIRQLQNLGIPFDITPGVPAYAAAAAALETEFTLPGVSQSLICQNFMRSPQCNRETLENFGRTGATLAIHLSIRNIKKIQNDLEPYYGANCPTAIVYRATWSDQKILRGKLSTLAKQARAAKITRTALILIGPVLGVNQFNDSALYSPDHTHVLRPHKSLPNNPLSHKTKSGIEDYFPILYSVPPL